jgi:hypothetical protein
MSTRPPEDLDGFYKTLLAASVDRGRGVLDAKRGPNDGGRAVVVVGGASAWWGGPDQHLWVYPTGSSPGVSTRAAGDLASWTFFVVF